MLTLADLYQTFVSARPATAEQSTIADVVVDSRQVKPGALFVALQGEVRDGHEFIPDALERGAAAIVAEARAQGVGPGLNVQIVNVDAPSNIPLDSDHAAGLQPGPNPPVLFLVPSSLGALQQLAAWWRSRSSCKVIGVTGSVGKSSTKELIAAVLQRRFATLKNKGNLNNEIGLPLTLLKLNETHTHAVLEMSTYAIGEIRRLCEIARPSVGVVTNVGPSHLERLGSMERIARAKSELVEALPEDGVAILNGDDPRVRAMSARSRCPFFLYGLNPSCDLWAENIESYGLEGIAFDMHHGPEKLHVRVPLLGRHSVHTALAAAAVGLTEKMPWYDILMGLQDVSAQLRLIAVPGEKGTTILDDTYNASPESSLAALNLLAELIGRKVAVLGDMLELGPVEERGHRLVGGRAAQVVQALIAVGARGRWIGEAAQEAGLANLHFAEDNAQAIKTLREIMLEGDMILIKGSRGAQMEEIVSALTRPGENGNTESNGWPGL